MSALKTRYGAAIAMAIARARASRDLRTVKASDGAEVTVIEESRDFALPKPVVQSVSMATGYSNSP